MTTQKTVKPTAQSNQSACDFHAPHMAAHQRAELSARKMKNSSLATSGEGPSLSSSHSTSADSPRNGLVADKSAGLVGPKSHITDPGSSNQPKFRRDPRLSRVVALLSTAPLAALQHLRACCASKNWMEYRSRMDRFYDRFPLASTIIAHHSLDCFPTAQAFRLLLSRHKGDVDSMVRSLDFTGDKLSAPLFQVARHNMPAFKAHVLSYSLFQPPTVDPQSFDPLTTIRDALVKMWQMVKRFGLVGEILIGLWLTKQIVKRRALRRFLFAAGTVAFAFHDCDKMPPVIKDFINFASVVVPRHFSEKFEEQHAQECAAPDDTRHTANPDEPCTVDPQSGVSVKGLFVLIATMWIGRRAPLFQRVVHSSKLTSAIEGFFDSTSDGLVTCVNIVYKFFSRSNEELIKKTLDSVRVLEQKATTFRAKLASSSIVPGPTEYLEYKQLLSELHVEIQHWPRSCTEYKSLRRVEAELIAMAHQFTGLSSSVGTIHQQQTGIYFYSKPGLGKSLCTQGILEHLYTLLHPTATPYRDLPPNLRFYSVDPSQEFFDTYLPGTFAVVFDDFGQSNLVPGDTGVIDSIITAVNGLQRSFNAAECSAKGRLMAQHEITVVTTNISSIKVSMGKVMADVYALKRRFPVSVELALLPQWKSVSDALAETQDPNNIWTFYPFDMVGGVRTGPAISYSQLLRKCLDVHAKLAKDFAAISSGGLCLPPEFCKPDVPEVTPQGAFGSICAAVGRKVSSSGFRVSKRTAHFVLKRAGLVGVALLGTHLVVRRTVKTAVNTFTSSMSGGSLASFRKTCRALAGKTVLAVVGVFSASFLAGSIVKVVLSKLFGTDTRESGVVNPQGLGWSSESYAKDENIASIQRNIRRIFGPTGFVGYGLAIDDNHLVYPVHFHGSHLHHASLEVEVHLCGRFERQPLVELAFDWSLDTCISRASKLSAKHIHHKVHSMAECSLRDAYVVPMRGEPIVIVINPSVTRNVSYQSSKCSFSNITLYTATGNDMGPGSCGLPVVSQALLKHGQAILGFHTARDPNEYKYPNMFTSIIKPVQVRDLCPPKPVCAQSSDMFVPTPTPPITLCATRGKFVSMHNNLITTPYTGTLGPTNRTLTLPGKTWLEDTTESYNLSPQVENKEFTKIAFLTTKHILSTVRPPEPYPQLTIEQALYGDPGLGLPGVNMSTSPGYPFNAKYTTKREMVGTVHDPGPGLQTLRNSVEQWLSGKEEHRAVHSLTPKFETRPPGKATRPIQTTPINMLVAVRQRLLPVIKNIVDKRGIAGISVGMAPNREAGNCYATMGASPDALVCAGDLKQQDRSQERNAMSAILRALCSEVDDGSEEFQRFQTVLIRDTASFSMLTGEGSIANKIVQYLGSLPTGHSLTSHLNSFYTTSLVAYAVYKENGDSIAAVYDFLDGNPRFVYGDDLMIPAGPLCPDLFALKKHSAACGMRVTDHNGNEPTKGFERLADVSFLARSFVVDPDTKAVSLALDMESIKGMFDVRKPSTPLQTHLRGVLDSAMMELAGHGKAKFLEHFDTLNALASKHHISLKLSYSGKDAYLYWRSKYDTHIPEWSVWDMSI